MSGLLNGMRIVEGAAFVAVPLAGMTLAQMGADVIRFDRLQGGLDATRWPVAATGQSHFWAGLNKAKRSIAIDMKSPRAVGAHDPPSRGAMPSRPASRHRQRPIGRCIAIGSRRCRRYKGCS